ncbi:Clampless protein 1 [Mycena venus]|uniref:Clampless protein 1 n=1 Tax=Mycena venus TaxID=2733690 RepID=A0A8H7CMK8_9AGAR|nr:Clampless protein 1 [Mycena venus]
MPAMSHVTPQSMDPRPVASIPTFKLPSRLERPPPCSDSVSRRTLDTVAPDLVELPLPFIQHQLALHTEQMLAGLHDLQVPSTIPRLDLPNKLEITLPEHSSHDQPIYPTHVFAVSLPSDSAAPSNVFPDLVSFHGIVFAAHCAARIPFAVPADEDDSAIDTVSLTVCPVVLPSAQALITLRTYMYTKSIDTLFASFFPLPEPLTHETFKSALESSETKSLLAARLVSVHHGFAHLLGYTALVQDVWQTAYCLEMYHTEFWDALDLAWELVIMALNLAADAQQSQQSEDGG